MKIEKKFLNFLIFSKKKLRIIILTSILLLSTIFTAYTGYVYYIQEKQPIKQVVFNKWTVQDLFHKVNSTRELLNDHVISEVFSGLYFADLDGNGIKENILRIKIRWGEKNSFLQRNRNHDGRNARDELVALASGKSNPPSRSQELYFSSFQVYFYVFTSDGTLKTFKNLTGLDWHFSARIIKLSKNTQKDLVLIKSRTRILVLENMSLETKYAYDVPERNSLLYAKNLEISDIDADGVPEVVYMDVNGSILVYRINGTLMLNITLPYPFKDDMQEYKLYAFDLKIRDVAPENDNKEILFSGLYYNYNFLTGYNDLHSLITWFYSNGTWVGFWIDLGNDTVFDWISVDVFDIDPNTLKLSRSSTRKTIGVYYVKNYELGPFDVLVAFYDVNGTLLYEESLMDYIPYDIIDFGGNIWGDFNEDGYLDLFVLPYTVSGLFPGTYYFMDLRSKIAWKTFNSSEILPRYSPYFAFFNYRNDFLWEMVVSSDNFWGKVLNKNLTVMIIDMGGTVNWNVTINLEGINFYEKDWIAYTEVDDLDGDGHVEVIVHLFEYLHKRYLKEITPDTFIYGTIIFETKTMGDKTNAYFPLLDVDEDHFQDGIEQSVYYTNPYKNDTDDDNYSDFEEIKTWKTNPLDPTDTPARKIEEEKLRQNFITWSTIITIIFLALIFGALLFIKVSKS